MWTGSLSGEAQWARALHQQAAPLPDQWCMKLPPGSCNRHIHLILARIPIERSNGCMCCCNSKTTGPIHAVSSSMESSLPIDVQRHGWSLPCLDLTEIPFEHQNSCRSCYSKQKRVNRFTPSQVLWWFVFNFCQLYGDIDATMSSHLCLKWCFRLRKLVNWQLSSDRSAYQLIKWDAKLMCHQMYGRHVLLGLSLLTSDLLQTIS